MVLTGGTVGLLAVLLVEFGNPANMGICVACFIRDIAGAIGLHQASVVQNVRPEILGFLLGSFLVARYAGEFRATGGSSPLIRFFLGIFVMIGALVFLGCPLRMVLRLAAGDLNALVGVFGFGGGIILGTQFLKAGFTLGRAANQIRFSGYVLPLVAASLFLLLLITPASFILSETGPGSAFAPILLSLVAGLLVGGLAQRSRLCFAGGIRDLYLIRDSHLLVGFLAVLVIAALGNLLFGFTQIGFANQPIAHTDGLWNFLGMFLVGFGSILLGGCPLRQVILAGEGNTDSAITVLGLLVGAAIAHNFSLAASPQGVSASGKMAVIVGILFVAGVGMAGIYFSKYQQGKGNQKGVSLHG